MSVITASSRLRHVLPLAALFVMLVVPAEGQRRRAVRFPGPAVPVQGDCHTFNFVRAGLKATYLTTAPSGNANYTITYIFDNATQTKTTQVVTTSQGKSDVETLIDSEVFGILRGIKHINVKASQTVPVLGKVTTEVDLSFVPSLTAGPAAGWCVGNTWSVPPVTETVVTKSPGVTLPPQIITTAASMGEVLAVGDTISVPAGSFRTVKYRGVFVAGTSIQNTVTWVSMADNIVVRQDTLDSSGAVTSTTTLTALQ
jgi:hypothetical protein